MTRSGLINVGQLAMEEHEKDGVVRVGFGSHEGAVIAAYHWNGEMTKMKVPESKFGSWEHLLHDAGAYNKLLILKELSDFKSRIGHRAIGVVYDPDNEKGNYVPSVIPERYEAFIYIDKTHPLHPLCIKPNNLQMPETFPWGV